MVIAFCLLVVAASWHFAYDGVILPSIRMGLRNKLFVLRDQLRALKTAGDCEDGAFDLVHDGINFYLTRLSALTISFQVEYAKRYQSDQGLRERVERRRAIIESCRNPEIRRIVKEADAVLQNAMIANTGGWYVYVVPIAIVVVFIKKISTVAKELLATSRVDAGAILAEPEAA